MYIHSFSKMVSLTISTGSLSVSMETSCSQSHHRMPNDCKTFEIKVITFSGLVLKHYLQ